MRPPTPPRPVGGQKTTTKPEPRLFRDIDPGGRHGPQSRSGTRVRQLRSPSPAQASKWADGEGAKWAERSRETASSHRGRRRCYTDC